MPETTAAYLERLVTAMVNVYNTRDFDFQTADAKEAVSHISADWLAQTDTTSTRHTWPQHVEEWKKRVQKHPDNYWGIIEMSSSVNERQGYAVVFISHEVTGLADVTLHSMVRSHWRRVDGVWECYYNHAMRGSLVNAGV